MVGSKQPRSAFTIVELLVVIAVISILAAILFPVFAQAREKAGQTMCLSNQRQLGMAILLYTRDYDETFPNGINQYGQQRVWPGEGWAGQSMPYVKSSALYRCSSDMSGSAQAHNTPVSYGYNINFIGYLDEEDDPPPSGLTFAALTLPARSVLLFEVSNVSVNLTDSLEGTQGGSPGLNFSAASNGLDNRLYAQIKWFTSVENTYATGYLGGRLPYNPTSTQFPSADGRHLTGANYLLGDGHAKWMRGASVSSGLTALSQTCNQANDPPLAGCSGLYGMYYTDGKYYAAGTQNQAGAFQATFSTR